MSEHFDENGNLKLTYTQRVELQRNELVKQNESLRRQRDLLVEACKAAYAELLYASRGDAVDVISEALAAVEEPAP